MFFPCRSQERSAHPIPVVMGLTPQLGGTRVKLPDISILDSHVGFSKIHGEVSWANDQDHWFLWCCLPEIFIQWFQGNIFTGQSMIFPHGFSHGNLGLSRTIFPSNPPPSPRAPGWCPGPGALCTSSETIMKSAGMPERPSRGMMIWLMTSAIGRYEKWDK